MKQLYSVWYALLGLFLMALAVNARAVSVFDPLTTAIDFTTVTAALFTVAATIVGVLVAIKGIKWIYHMLQGR